MSNRSPFFVLLVFTILIVVSILAPIHAQTDDSSVTPVPIPTTVYQSQDEIDNWIQDDNVAKMYSHAWEIWAAMTTLSGQTITFENGELVELPVWDTWSAAYNIFQEGNLGSARFDSIHQLEHFADEKEFIGDDFVTSSVRYDPNSAAFILENNYNTKAGLQTIQPCGSDSHYPDCSVQFATTSINMKPVLYPIHGNGISVFPVWKGITPFDYDNPTVTVDFDDLLTVGLDIDKWLNCIAIDLTGTYTPGDTIEITSNDLLACSSATVVAFEEFYSIPVDNEVYEQYEKVTEGDDPEFDGATNSFVYTPDTGTISAQKLAVGDRLIFVASHVTTREIPEWVWFTVWWSPQPDEETTIPFPPTQTNTQDYIQSGEMYANYPGTGWGRPTDIKEPWDNYVLCINYMFVYPHQPLVGGTNKDTYPQFCFNPYLEAGFTDKIVPSISDTFLGGGINTNCMSCHGNANYDESSGGPSYMRAYYTDRDDPQFNNVRLLDFAWSLQRAISE